MCAGCGADMDNARLRESLGDFTKWLRELAKKSAAHPYASNDDRRILGDEAELLASSVESLVNIIAAHEAYVLWMADVSQAMCPEDKAKLSRTTPLPPFSPLGLVDLSGALVAAFRIGVRALESPVIRRMEKETKAARARKGRTEKSQQLDRDIFRLAQPLLAKYPSWKAPSVAAAIAPSINKNRAHPVSDNAIEKKVRRLFNLKKHGRQAGHPAKSRPA